MISVTVWLVIAAVGAGSIVSLVRSLRATDPTKWKERMDAPKP